MILKYPISERAKGYSKGGVSEVFRGLSNTDYFDGENINVDE